MKLDLELTETEVEGLADTCRRLGLTTETFALVAVRRHLLHTRTRLNREQIQIRAQEAYDLATEMTSGTRFTINHLLEAEDWWIAMHQLDHKIIGKAFRALMDAGTIGEHVDRRTNNLAVYERL